MTARTATLLILLLTQTAVFGAGGTFTGRVERVIDGDTIIVRVTLPHDGQRQLHLPTLSNLRARFCRPAAPDCVIVLSGCNNQR